MHLLAAFGNFVLGVGIHGGSQNDRFVACVSGSQRYKFDISV